MIRKSVPEQAPQVSADIDGRIMHSDKRVEAILLTLQPGEKMPLHKNPYDVLFAGISGQARLEHPNGQLQLKAGETIFVTADEGRAWINHETEPARIMVFKILQ